MLTFHDINAKLRYIKSCLFLFTFLFVLSGIALITIGSTINAVYYDFMFFLRLEYMTPPTCAVLLGFLIIAVGGIGLYGTLKGHVLVIGAFGGLLGFLCVVQITAGVAGNVFVVPRAFHNLEVTLNESVWNYPYDKFLSEQMDAVQEDLACCGNTGPQDWLKVYNGSEIPRSCCAYDEENDMCEYIHNVGCYTRLLTFLVDSTKMLTTSYAVLVFMQLMGMAFAFFLIRCLNQLTQARKERKMLVTEQLLYSDADSNKSPF